MSPNTAKLEHEGDIHRRGIERFKRHDIPSIFNMIGAIESKLINGIFGHNNLVKAQASVQGDEVELAIVGAKVLDSIGAQRNRDFERKGEQVELAIRDTEPPNKIVYVNDILLMRFRGEHDHRGPGVVGPGANPAAIEQCGDVSSHDLPFMHTVTRRWAATRLRDASVDAELDTDNGPGHTC